MCEVSRQIPLMTTYPASRRTDSIRLVVRTCRPIMSYSVSHPVFVYLDSSKT
jgi:hypothetical protein